MLASYTSWLNAIADVVKSQCAHGVSPRMSPSIRTVYKPSSVLYSCYPVADGSIAAHSDNEDGLLERAPITSISMNSAPWTLWLHQKTEKTLKAEAAVKEKKEVKKEESGEDTTKAGEKPKGEAEEKKESKEEKKKEAEPTPEDDQSPRRIAKSDYLPDFALALKYMRVVVIDEKKLKPLKFVLGRGSFFVMGGECQKWFKHAIPVDAEERARKVDTSRYSMLADGARVSATLRISASS